MSGNGKSNNDKFSMLDPSDPLATVIASLGGESDGPFQTFPGIDGIPHRARGVRLYKEDDPERMRPRSAGRVRCEVFDISDPEHKKRFEILSSLVYSMARQGKAVLTAVDRRFDVRNRSWLIYFEWIELFTYDPLSAHEQTRIEPGVLRRRGV